MTIANVGKRITVGVSRTLSKGMGRHIEGQQPHQPENHELQHTCLRAGPMKA